MISIIGSMITIRISRSIIMFVITIIIIISSSSSSSILRGRGSWRASTGRAGCTSRWRATAWPLYIYIYIYIYIYTHIHIYIYIYIHTYNTVALTPTRSVKPSFARIHYGVRRFEYHQMSPPTLWQLTRSVESSSVMSYSILSDNLDLGNV